nr:MFS transporter [Tessaracoccus coleopterorum]
MSLGWLRTRVSANRLVMLAAVVYGTSLVGTQLVQQAWSVALLTFLASTTWTATVSTLNSELQLMLPGWVRARALAMLSMVFAGSQAAASPFWGALIQLWGLKAVLAAAGLAFLGAAAGWPPAAPPRGDPHRPHARRGVA